jgi:hypothetical protein
MGVGHPSGRRLRAAVCKSSGNDATMISKAVFLPGTDVVLGDANLVRGYS